MSVVIETVDDVTTISYLGWDVPLHLKNGEFDHFGIPKHAGDTNYIVISGMFRDEQGLTFANPCEAAVGGAKQCNVDIGKLNKDGSVGDYATVWVSKGRHTIRGSSLAVGNYKVPHFK